MKRRENIPNLNTYNDGFQKGMTLALQSEKIDMKKHNPFSAMFSHSKWRSYKSGLEAGFVQGVRLREQNHAINRFKELNRIEKNRSSR